MKNLYCPWREKYINENKNTKNYSCIFCDHASSDQNEKNYILYKDKNNIVCLNLYPYNAGHLLVIPKKHISELFELSEKEQNEIMHLISKSTKILKNTLKCQGVNVGANIGSIAGAGIADHIHFHVVPRWQGDTNFMPITCNTKQISCDMQKIYKQLKKEFTK